MRLRSLACVTVLCLALGACAGTPPIVDAAGRPVPGSVAAMESVTLGGIAQSVWFRARDQRALPLIVLHGGPGVSEAALFRHFDADLEDDFLVVHWEQRGTGRSYPPARDAPPTLERLLGDLDELVEHVRRRFGASRVALLGHSFGTVLALRYAHAHPDKVAVSVSVAQVVAPVAGDRLGYHYALSEAARRRDDAALESLRRIGPPPHDVDQTLALGRHLERYGGVFHGDLSTGKLIWAALSEPEVTLLDIVRFGQGNRFSLETLTAELNALDLRSLDRFDVPIVFIEGRHDWRTPSSLAESYWNVLKAPCKRLVWFEASAHNPPFEQPRAFVDVMRTEVLPIARGQACEGAAVRSIDRGQRSQVR